MQKSKDISKYDIHWQIVRVQAKKYKDISSKINYVLDFYSNHKTLDNHERIMNWLEGLAMGYRDVHTKAKILGTKVLFDKSTFLIIILYVFPAVTAGNRLIEKPTEKASHTKVLPRSNKLIV